ncbi:hypothetical protein D915_005623 [Fasciola hepatica]|uniref:Uncharacterized protein n=1 Tax=Fasciola hepatica TaxID=6192 RepID=A0A2H1C8I6_FASHE|nr:hypothetical protein D915_005623 [Fasciola hepatica]
MVPDKLLATIQHWTSGEYPGFVSCVNVLSELKGSDGKEFVGLIHALRDRVHLLPEHLVRQLLEPLSDPNSWKDCDTSLIEEVTQLLISIAVHFNDLSQDMVDILVLLIFTESAASASDDKKLSVQFFKQLMKVAPQSERLITERLLHKFPGWRRPSKDLLWPTMNGLFLFCSSETAKFLSASSKAAFASKLCHMLIDLEFSLDDADRVSTPQNSKPPVDDEDFKSMRTITCRFVEEKISTDTGNNWMKLDLLTWFVLSHLRFLCARSDSTKPELDWSLLCTVFKRMRELFSQHILPVSTFLTAFPLVFLFTTTLRGGLMVNLTEFLWTVVKDEHKITENRINALSFLTFLMTRVNACFLDLVIELLHEMAGWCVDYVYQNRSRLSRAKIHDLPQTNMVYYAVCDSLFFTITQLHASLFDSIYYRSSCDRMPLAQIILSPLNPMSHMKVALRDSISLLASAYNLGWSMITVGMGSHLEDPLTCCRLGQLEPSSLFSLPFSAPRLPLSESFLPRMLRCPRLGKALTDITGSSNQLEPSRRKRQKPNNTTFLVVDSSKIARIISNN